MFDLEPLCLQKEIMIVTQKMKSALKIAMHDPTRYFEWLLYHTKVQWLGSFEWVLKMLQHSDLQRKRNVALQDLDVFSNSIYFKKKHQILFLMEQW